MGSKIKFFLFLCVLCIKVTEEANIFNSKESEFKNPSDDNKLSKNSDTVFGHQFKFEESKNIKSLNSELIDNDVAKDEEILRILQNAQEPYSITVLDDRVDELVDDIISQSSKLKSHENIWNALITLANDENKSILIISITLTYFVNNLKNFFQLMM